MADMKKFIDDFLEYCEIEKNRSPKTLENYRRYLLHFADFARIAHPSEITADMVRQYRLALHRSTDARGARLKMNRAIRIMWIVQTTLLISRIIKRSIPQRAWM